MARHQKTGIDYFSHDTDTFSDQEMRYIIAKYGIMGYGVYFAILEKIYKNKGYYLEFTEEFKTIFTADYKIGIKEFTTLIEDLISRELFNKTLFDKYKILTSRRIQENYLKGSERRTEINLTQEYLLVNPEIIIVNIKEKNVNINPLNVDRNGVDADISTQSKVKESKGNKNKGKEKEAEIIPPTLVQVQELFNLREYPPNEAERFFNYYESNGWRVGKNPMKKWHNAAANWNKNIKNYGTNQTRKGQSDQEVRIANIV